VRVLGLRAEDLLLAAWNAAGVPIVGVSALAPIAGLAAFYASLVVAPRLLVDPEPADGCLAWPLRFVLYLVSAALGIGWLAALAA
jgi:hypothetical protein